MHLSLLLACTDPVRETPQGGEQGEDVALLWDSDHAVDSDYVVEVGQTLTVTPGVTVLFAPGTQLVVEGELLARGSAEAPIVFTGDGAARWGGMVFGETATDAVFENVDDYAAGSILEHVVVENAARGVEIVGSAPYVFQATLVGHEIPITIDTIGGAGMLIRDGATPRVRETTFSGNVANTFAFGGGLYVHHADPIIQDCSFLDNIASYGAGMSTDWMASPIVGSQFSGNRSQSEGGGLSLISSMSAVLANEFTANDAESDGAGIHICVTCDPHANPALYDNVVVGNESENSDPDEGAAGIGGAFLGGFASNDVYENLRDGSPSDFGWFNVASESWPGWAASPALSDTYWGTTDPTQIAETVYDGADSDRYGTVRVESPRSTPIGEAIPRAVLGTRQVHYEDTGEEMPIFLSLYNPGPRLTIQLAIQADGAPFTGELAYPAGTRTETGWTLDMPENSVWFATILESAYDGITEGELAWTATLSDSATGAVIGVPSATHAVLQPYTAQ